MDSRNGIVNIRNILEWCVKVLLAGGIALIFLSFVCYFYSYSGIHIANESGATDYTWESGQWKATMTEGFSWLHMDKNGFNNLETYSKEFNMDVLLMGASHMEAVNVAQKDNIGTLLNEHGVETYNIGTSAHDIYTCVNNIALASEVYAPQKAIIIQTDSISLSEEAMQQVLDGQYARIPSYDTGVVYQLQKIPAIKVLYKQLEQWIETSGDHRVGAENILSLQEEDTKYERTLSDFLTFAKAGISASECKLIILYTPTFSVTEEGEMLFNTDSADYNLFRKACDDVGIVVVDMTEEFQTEYRVNHRLVYGFTNTVPGAGHLNKYGHKLVADKLINTLAVLE